MILGTVTKIVNIMAIFVETSRLIYITMKEIMMLVGKRANALSCFIVSTFINNIITKLTNKVIVIINKDNEKA